MAAKRIAYLGAFSVPEVLWRGDLWLDEKGYASQFTFTAPDGSTDAWAHRLDSDTEQGAVNEALLAAMEYFKKQGYDLAFMNIIHYAPGMSSMVDLIRKEHPACEILQ